MGASICNQATLINFCSLMMWTKEEAYWRKRDSHSGTLNLRLSMRTKKQTGATAGLEWNKMAVITRYQRSSSVGSLSSNQLFHYGNVVDSTSLWYGRIALHTLPSPLLTSSNKCTFFLFLHPPKEGHHSLKTWANSADFTFSLEGLLFLFGRRGTMGLQKGKEQKKKKRG